MTIAWSVGQFITANRLNLRNPITAEKSATTTVNTDATVNPDPDLVLNLNRDITYDVRGLLLVSSATNAAGDFRRSWSWTNTATVIMGGAGGSNAIASGTLGDGEWAAYAPDATSPAQDLQYFASTTVSGIWIADRVIVSTSDVVLTLTWAQSASNANNTSLHARSFITAIPVF